MNKPYILCVDDDKTILMSLRAQLKRGLGDQFAYEVAESAREAWEVINEFKESGISLSLIISDWMMPEIKGDEFLIQVHSQYPEIPKMMLTGQADPEAIKRAQDFANLACCLTKPWNRDSLIETIKAVIH
ncbi:Two-component response regulator [gamma proteobacterium HdN1]|nr:Two-component response regulator [gamma proteobacterium HdN1]